MVLVSFTGTVSSYLWHATTSTSIVLASPRGDVDANSASSEYSVLRWSGALTFGYGCTVYVGVDVGAGDVEVDVIYISFT